MIYCCEKRKCMTKLKRFMKKGETSKKHYQVMHKTYHYHHLEAILVIRVEVVISVSQLVVMMMITTHKMKMVAQEGLMTQRYERKKWVDFRERKNFKIPSSKTPQFALDVTLTRKHEVILTHTSKNSTRIYLTTCVENVIVDS